MLPLRISGITRKHPFIVVPGLSCSALLGKDFLNKYRAVINFGSGELCLGNNLPIYFIGQDPKPTTKEKHVTFDTETTLIPHPDTPNQLILPAIDKSTLLHDLMIPPH